MNQRMNKIGIIIETENGSVKETNFGMITLANRGNAQLYALMGENAASAGASLAEYGITTVVDLGLPEEATVRLNPDVRAKAVVAAVPPMNKKQLDHPRKNISTTP